MKQYFIMDDETGEVKFGVTGTVDAEKLFKLSEKFYEQFETNLSFIFCGQDQIFISFVDAETKENIKENYFAFVNGFFSNN